MEKVILLCIFKTYRAENGSSRRKFFSKNYGSRSKKGEFLRFELSYNALNRKPQK